MKIGDYQTLTAFRHTDFGWYLIDDDYMEILLPNAYVPEQFDQGDTIRVFIYLDSEERPVATTLNPLISLGQFAYLTAKDVSQHGAFMDWGLMKDLFVPFAEQRKRFEVGQDYLIYLLKDELSDRLIGSNKEHKYLTTENVDVKPGEEVNVLIYKPTPLGMNAIVNNKYKGLIFQSDITQDLYPGNELKAYVKKIREDGKIDLSLSPIGYRNKIDSQCQKILDAIQSHDGFLKLHDKSDPEKIQKVLGMSKKSFKQSIGKMYKERIIDISKSGIRLIKVP